MRLDVSAAALGLAVTTRRSACAAWALLGALLAIFARRRLGYGVGAALGFGVCATALHVASVLVHHLGHAMAARAVGYPMQGVRLWGVLGTSVYPQDEPELTAATHVTRALGGPLASIAVGVLLAALPRRGALTTFMLLDNALFLGAGSFAPLGFTDGSTLLRYLRRH